MKNHRLKLGDELILHTDHGLVRLKLAEIRGKAEAVVALEYPEGVKIQAVKDLTKEAGAT